MYISAFFFAFSFVFVVNGALQERTMRAMQTMPSNNYYMSQYLRQGGSQSKPYYNSQNYMRLRSQQKGSQQQQSFNAAAAQLLGTSTGSVGGGQQQQGGGYTASPYALSYLPSRSAATRSPYDSYRQSFYSPTAVTLLPNAFSVNASSGGALGDGDDSAGNALAAAQSAAALFSALSNNVSGLTHRSYMNGGGVAHGGGGGKQHYYDMPRCYHGRLVRRPLCQDNSFGMCTHIDNYPTYVVTRLVGAYKYIIDRMTPVVTFRAADLYDEDTNADEKTSIMSTRGNTKLFTRDGTPIDFAGPLRVRKRIVKKNLCDIDSEYFRPGWARNSNGYWVLVLNAPYITQKIRSEICILPDEECPDVPGCYDSWCRQKYTFLPLVALDPCNLPKGPYVDVFRVPTACECHREL